MEDLILKGFELGALGLISLFLLTKGTSALKELSDSNKLLADAVTKLSDKVNALDTRVTGFEYELRSIDAKTLADKFSTLETRLDRIEFAISSLVKG